MTDVVIPGERIAGLATLLAASVPVLAIAFYTVRNTPDLLEALPAERHAIRVRQLFWRLLKVPLLKQTLGGLHFEVDPAQPGRILIRKHWRVGTDLGFVVRATPAFLLAMAPWLLGYDDPIARAMLGVSLVLNVFSFNALIIYSTAITAMRMDYHSASEEALRSDSVNSTYGGNSIVYTNLVGLVTGAASILAGVLLAFSSPA